MKSLKSLLLYLSLTHLVIFPIGISHAETLMGQRLENSLHTRVHEKNRQQIQQQIIKKFEKLKTLPREKIKVLLQESKVIRSQNDLQFYHHIMQKAGDIPFANLHFSTSPTHVEVTSESDQIKVEIINAYLGLFRINGITFSLNHPEGLLSFWNRVLAQKATSFAPTFFIQEAHALVELILAVMVIGVLTALIMNPDSNDCKFKKASLEEEIAKSLELKSLCLSQKENIRENRSFYNTNQSIARKLYREENFDLDQVDLKLLGQEVESFCTHARSSARMERMLTTCAQQNMIDSFQRYCAQMSELKHCILDSKAYYDGTISEERFKAGPVTPTIAPSKTDVKPQ